MKSRILSFSLSFFVIGASLVACDAALLDLGTNAVADAGPQLASEDGGLVTAKAGCSEWIDDDIHLASANECSGTCAATSATPTTETHFAFDSRKRFIDLTGGAWLRCSGTFGPSDTVGVELAPGCRLYFLHYDTNGKLARGAEIRHQGVFGIFDPATNALTRRLDVSTTEAGTITYDVTMQTCPKALVLTPSSTLPGRAAERVVLRPAREIDGGAVGTFPR